jgi:hypothetical protein
MVQPERGQAQAACRRLWLTFMVGVVLPRLETRQIRTLSLGSFGVNPIGSTSVTERGGVAQK